MEKKRWVFIFSALCLALAFSVSSVEAQEMCSDPTTLQMWDLIMPERCDRDGDCYVRDNRSCRNSNPDAIIDCDDSAPSEDNICVDVDDGDTTTSKKSIPLIMTFNDVEVDEECVDNICSDDGFPYIDNEERVGVSAGGRSQPNPAAGIHMGLGAKPRVIRQLDLNIICEPIDVNGDLDFDDAIDVDNCNQLPEVFDDEDEFLGYGFSVFLPECEGNNFCNLGAAVRPYKVNCPKKLLNGKCPDIFTMLPSTHLPPPEMIRDPVLMSFRLFVGGGPTVEVASAIGADGSQDPGRCLSLHPDPAALAEAVCTTETGMHGGDPDSPDLVDNSGVNFLALDISVGADIVKNVDDGTQGVIIAVTADTIFTDPAAGIVWDVNESYTIVRTSKCNVSVTAFDEGSFTNVGPDDGENDEWDVEAIGVTALICNGRTSTVLGKATLTFGFHAIKKE